ncbi:MAG: glycosyltransferase, partial [Candidatus Aminicenantes bacterium]|nr:glycosyltransferase [Candidatus Aminicenantes bacterium]
LPVYNEKEVIEQVVRENFAFISQFPNGKLIITEDGSTDGTKTILKSLQKELGYELHSSSYRKGA